MVIDFDHNPNLTPEQKLQSLKESVQMALEEMAVAVELLNKELQELRQTGD